MDASDGPVAVAQALGQGDDAVVALARMRAGDGWEVTVVTADRRLRGRVTEEGCAVLGPSWLLGRPDSRAEAKRSGVPP